MLTFRGYSAIVLKFSEALANLQLNFSQALAQTLAKPQVEFCILIGLYLDLVGALAALQRKFKTLAKL